MIEPKDTFYKGNYFRSRLETRWAVYFDLLGVKYEYEPQGFEFNNKYSYLPDFKLTNSELYIEVKNENAMYINNYRLVDGTEKAYRYQKIGEQFAQEGILYVIFFGTPYDYVNDGFRKWWTYQGPRENVTFVNNHEMLCSLAVSNIASGLLDPCFKKEAELAAKIRFEHGASPEDQVSKFKQEKSEFMSQIKTAISNKDTDTISERIQSFHDWMEAQSDSGC